MIIKKSSWRVSGFHRGIVKDNADPEQQGRVRVCIPVLFEDIATQYLPWAAPAMPFSFGGGAGSGHGSFCVPEVDSTVWCFFEGDDYNQPVYFAAAPDGTHGLPTERTINYPDRRVVKTANGIVIYVDDEDDEIKVIHPTGKYVEMDGGGNVVVDGANVSITASGTITINASGTITVSADGVLTLEGSTVNINP